MNFKKVGIVIFTVLFVGVACLVPCFAIDVDGMVLTFDDIIESILLDDVEAIFSIYSPNDQDGQVGNFSSGWNQIDYDLVEYYVDLDIQNADSSIVEVYFYNMGSSSLYINFTSYTDILPESPLSFEVPSGDEYSFYFSFLDNTVSSRVLTFTCTDYEISNDDFSVYNPSGLIGIVGSIGTLIFSSPVLIVLFFIGVTCSLGFVAVRFIRKVMWSN